MPREKQVTRECALTRQSRPASDLIRFVAGPDGVIAPDVDARAPGRGVWVTLYEPLVAEAARRNVFARSLKQKVTVPADLAQLTRTRLEQRLAGALGLARKAGQIVTGAAKVDAALRQGKAVALFTASDAAPDGRRKMLQALRAADGAETIPHFELLAADRMGLSLGLENVIHAALTTGAAAEQAMVRAKRLARYLAEPDEREEETHE